VTVTYPNNGPIDTVNFHHMASVDAVSDVSGRVKLTATPFVHIGIPPVFATTLQITNTSNADINGNLRVDLRRLNSSVALVEVLFNGQKLAVRHLNGETFFTIPVSVLSAGQILKVELAFSAPSAALIHFLPHIFAVN
jgi:hypothetical protein